MFKGFGQPETMKTITEVSYKTCRIMFKTEVDMLWIGQEQLLTPSCSENKALKRQQYSYICKKPNSS